MMSVSPSSSCVSEKNPGRSSPSRRDVSENMHLSRGQALAGTSAAEIEPTHSASSTSVTLMSSRVRMSDMTRGLGAATVRFCFPRPPLVAARRA
eukprot:scaffold7567_cov104-Isochrysis_galbana.AAC.2